jgi:hypothetical protein
MRLVSSIADRMVSALLPQKSAAAGCVPETYTRQCQPCVKHLNGTYLTRQNCTLYSSCTVICGSCYNVACG